MKRLFGKKDEELYLYRATKASAGEVESWVAEDESDWELLRRIRTLVYMATLRKYNRERDDDR